MSWLAASLLATACGDDPPDREIQQAETAIASARSAGAGDYAHDELDAAEKALANAREAVTERDYRLALTNAIDSRERAQTAATQAQEEKRIVRMRVDRALRTAAATLSQLNGRLKTGAGARVPARALAAPRRTINEATEALQEARTAFNQSDYLGAEKAVQTATTRLAEASRALDVLAPAGSRHRG